MDRRLAAAAGMLIAALMLQAQVQMPNPKEISGVPLPAADVPAGTVSVRVIRGGFDKNVADQPVEFTIDGKTRTLRTDATGHVEVSGLKPGAKVQAEAVVDGERITSQQFALEASGIRLVLVATDPEAAKRAEEDRRLAAGPAVKGLVVLGPESRTVVELADEQLNVFYVLDIQNTARTPVDIGGPFIVDLPAEARGASLLEGSSKQATVTGARLTVTGPFAPGSTMVQVGFELPYTSGHVTLSQKFPAALEQLTVLMPQTGGLAVQSPQLASTRAVTDQGQPLLLASGPAVPAGQAVNLEIAGLPHHPLWPRYTALSLACGFMTIGIWAAVTARPRRQRA